jgi:prepilin-type N-terminal cleavage/methylation domain-containing protein
MLSKRQPKVFGFTLIELVIGIAVIGTLAAITYSYAVPKYRERSYLTRANSEMHTLANALTLYVAKYNDYPADVSRGIPAGIQEFLQQNYNNQWPNAPWPGSVYDYDYLTTWTYTDPSDLSPPIVQISIRMCNAGDSATCKANAEKYLKGVVDDSVLNNWDSYSSVYYCIKGSCRSHGSMPANHPGYCINCNGTTSKFF